MKPLVNHQPTMTLNAEPKQIDRQRVYDQRMLTDNLLRYTRQFDNKSLIDYNIVEADLSTTTVNVEHKLGRAYTGWIVVDNDANAVVYRDSTVSPDTTKYIPLKASAAAGVKLLVF